MRRTRYARHRGHRTGLGISQLECRFGLVLDDGRSWPSTCRSVIDSHSSLTPRNSEFSPIPAWQSQGFELWSLAWTVTRFFHLHGRGRSIPRNAKHHIKLLSLAKPGHQPSSRSVSPETRRAPVD